MQADSMYSLFVTLHAKPDSIIQFKNALLKVAQATVKEPDCFRYEVMEDKRDSTVFYIFEVFRNKEAHSKHTETDHIRDWWTTSGKLFNSKLEIIEMSTLFPSKTGFESQKQGLVNWLN